jgi:hypothetical protein
MFVLENNKISKWSHRHVFMPNLESDCKTRSTRNSYLSGLRSNRLVIYTSSNTIQHESIQAIRIDLLTEHLNQQRWVDGLICGISKGAGKAFWGGGELPPQTSWTRKIVSQSLWFFDSSFYLVSNLGIQSCIIISGLLPTDYWNASKTVLFLLGVKFEGTLLRQNVDRRDEARGWLLEWSARPPPLRQRIMCEVDAQWIHFVCC